MKVRKAGAGDSQQLLDIYNYEVENGVATLDLHPKTLVDWEVWMNSHNKGNHPLLVAETEGVIAGYVSLSSYRPKEAYQTSVELSLYVHPDWRRRKVAKLLMDEILCFARASQETHSVISVITAGNEASVRIHERYGFCYCGIVKEVGYKFGRYLDVLQYQLMV